MVTTKRRWILALLIKLCALFPAAAALAAVAPPAVTTLAPLSGQLSTPVRIAADGSGNIYLTDPRAGGILKFSSSGRYLATIATVKNPQGIAVTAAGDLVVSHGTAVSVLAPDGALKFQLGTGAGQFRMANAIAVLPSGAIYVTDSLDDCVQLFSATGTPLAVSAAAPGKPVNSFGSRGPGAGQLFQPAGIAYEKEGDRLAVVDSRNGRVQFFTPDGTPAGSIGSPGLGALKFTSPQGVAFSYEPTGAIMYVADAFQSNVQAIDLTARTLIRVIGSYGTSAGKLVAPTDVLFDSFDLMNRRLMVANGFGNLTLYGVQSTAPGAGAATGNGPSLTIDTLPLATNLTSFTLSGTAAAGATVTVSVNTQAAVGTIARAGLTWSVPVTGLVAGSNVFTVRATDSGGRATTATLGVLVIPSAPGLPVTPFTVTPLPSITATPLATLSGTVQPGATVTVNGSPATVSGGSWSYQANLSQGVNTLFVQATHPSFSEAVGGINLTLDSVPPVLTASLLPGGSTTASRVTTVSGTVADATRGTVTVTVNGVTTTVPAAPDGTFSAAVVLRPGANGISVAALDAAGNASAPAATSVTFSPAAPAVSFATPDGTTVSSASLAVSGSAPPGSTVTVNGVAAQVTGGSYSATVPLSPGLNTVVASATLNGETGSARLAVRYDPAAPQLSVSVPPRDTMLTGGPAREVAVTGNAGAGVTLSATVDGASAPVRVGSDGSFSVLFSVGSGSFGSHTVSVTAVDPFGNETTSVRSIVVADPTPPTIAVLSASPVRVSVGGGSILTARDKNGPVGTVTVSGDTSSIDLTGVSYDAATLNISAASPSGSLSRNGVLVPVSVPGQGWVSGVPGLADALEGLRIAVGSRPAGFSELLAADVAPLLNGVPAPDGRIDVEDVLAILMRSVGLW